MPRARRPSLRSIEERNVLAAQWFYLPGKIIAKARPGIRGADYDELVSVGMFALIRAAELWEQTKGVSFCDYASCIIRNEIKGVEPRETLKIPNTWNVKRRTPEAQVLAELGRVCTPFSALPRFEEDLFDPDPVTDPQGQAIDHETKERLMAEVVKLPDRLRLLLHCRFWNDMTLKETGEVLGVTKERCRQLEQETLERLRQALGFTGTT